MAELTDNNQALTFNGPEQDDEPFNWVDEDPDEDEEWPFGDGGQEFSDDELDGPFPLTEDYTDWLPVYDDPDPFTQFDEENDDA